jgi:hypothetical protein
MQAPKVEALARWLAAQIGLMLRTGTSVRGRFSNTVAAATKLEGVIKRQT